MRKRGICTSSGRLGAQSKNEAGGANPPRPTASPARLGGAALGSLGRPAPARAAQGQLWESCGSEARLTRVLWLVCPLTDPAGMAVEGHGETSELTRGFAPRTHSVSCCSSKAWRVLGAPCFGGVG